MRRGEILRKPNGYESQRIPATIHSLSLIHISPNYAMLCNAIPAVVNILLDYVFIFIFKWGMMGAALATSLGYILGAGMIVVY